MTFVSLFVESNVYTVNLDISNTYFYNFHKVYTDMLNFDGYLNIKESTFLGSVKESDAHFYTSNSSMMLRQTVINDPDSGISKITMTSSAFLNISMAVDINVYDTINIINCTFLSNYFRIWQKDMKSTEIKSTIHSYSDKTFIYNSSFIGNIAFQGGALHLYGVPYVKIVDTKFINNSAASQGGAIYTRATFHQYVYLSNCKFVDNFINSSHMGIILPTTIDHDYHLFGKGGAIMSTDSFLTINNVTFTENTAPSFGGTIYSGKRLHVTNSIIDGLTKRGSSIGSTVYARGNMILDQVLLNVHGSNKYESVLYYDAVQSSSTIISFIINCPTNNKLVKNRISGISYYQMLMYFCAPCEKGSYNIDHEYEIIHRYQNITTHTIDCHQCPSGGICDNVLISNDNYMGYKNGNGEVSFVQCPPLYCCSAYGQKCTSYHTCEINRRGALCGECISGYAENLLTTSCVENIHCGGKLFWFGYLIGSLICTIIMVYFNELTNIIKKFFRSFLTPLLKSISPLEENVRKLEPENVLNVTQTNCTNFNLSTTNGGMGAGLLNLVIFFYQVQFLIQVKSSAKRHYNIWWLWTDIVSSIFNFNPSANNKSFYLCAWGNMDAVEKEIFKLSVIFTTFFFLITIYCLWYGCYGIMIFWRWLIQTTLHNEQAEPLIAHNPPTETIDCPNERSISNGGLPFGLRIKHATLRLILFTYIPITTVALKLINCIYIGNSKHLFIYGNVRCYHWWQYFITSLLIVWIAPFCIYLYVATDLLKSFKIGPRQFLYALVFPPVTLFYYFKAKYCQNDSGGYCDHNTNLKGKYLLQVFCEPFKDKLSKWIGMVVFRKFCLSFASVFIINPVLRLYVVLLLLVIFQLIHFRVQPYKCEVLNWLETISFALLILFTGINLFWAHSFLSDIPQISVLRDLGEIFLYIELIGLLSPLFLLSLFFFIALFVYIYIYICHLIKAWNSKKD